MTQRSAERWNTGKRGAAMRKAEQQGRMWACSYQGDFTPKDLARELARRFPIHRKKYGRFMWGALRWVETQPFDF